VVEAAGGRVLAVGSIVVRTGGPRSETGSDRSPFDVPFVHLMERDLPTWPADECPLCREGGTAVQPGSRPKT
jgi:orotate phosphoribosyltransferase